MQKHKTLILPSLLAALLALPEASEAGPSINIEGAQFEMSAPSTPNLNNTYTCAADHTKQYTISGTPTLASVDSPTGPDWVMLENLTITATTPQACGHIFFWRTFAIPPSGVSGLQLNSNGLLPRPPTSAAQNSWVTVNAYTQVPAGAGANDGTSGTWYYWGTPAGNDPITNPDQTKTVFLLMPQGAGAFMDAGAPNPFSDSYDLGTSTYILKADVTFFLQNQGDQLVLNPTSGFLVQSSQGGGKSGPPIGIIPCPSCAFSWLWTTETWHWTFRSSAGTQDGVLKKAEKISMFFKLNFEDLAQEMAQGQGEHLASLASLLTVAREQHFEFFSLAQDAYRAQALQGPVTSEQMVSRLRESMKATPAFAKIGMEEVN